MKFAYNQLGELVLIEAGVFVIGVFGVLVLDDVSREEVFKVYSHRCDRPKRY